MFFKPWAYEDLYLRRVGRFKRRGHFMISGRPPKQYTSAVYERSKPYKFIGISIIMFKSHRNS